ALAPRQPHPQPRRLTRQPQLDHRRLADPGVATDKDDLARPLGCLLEAPLQDLDFGLAPDDRARRAWHPPSGPLPAVPPEPPIALPADGGEIPRRSDRIPQRRATLLHAHAQHGIADTRPAPP